MNLTYATAKPEQIPMLSDLWQRVFDEDPSVLNFFFQTMFTPQETLICMDENKLAAALYMLPAELMFEEKRFKAHYIFAAATEPCYRKRGIMGELLKLAETLGRERGESYSFLLPAEESLYDYYRRFGYEEFFNIREITLPNIKKGVKYTDKSKNEDCSVVWSEKHKAYAVFAHKAYGGEFFESDEGYAFYECSENCCYISDAYAKSDEKLMTVLRKLFQKLPSGLEIKLRTSPSLFKNEGKLVHHGMIKALGNHPIPKVETAHLNFSLE